MSPEQTQHMPSSFYTQCSQCSTPTIRQRSLVMFGSSCLIPTFVLLDWSSHSWYSFFGCVSTVCAFICSLVHSRRLPAATMFLGSLGALSSSNCRHRIWLFPLFSCFAYACLLALCTPHSFFFSCSSARPQLCPVPSARALAKNVFRLMAM